MKKNFRATTPCIQIISIHRTERGSTSPISSVILEEADC
ncbi:uncharacterized protein [Blastocystis hominis]|uniref:Uncharacterized protein n=1 Tax=Blastocystis hominis TaxID=12968 RepID=D8M898_BLAHO|nr:uncharacterized protein [Blastocystis hominis]CBK24287.2 unnamed protein product [Blastocystis hominis]|eukprot:XP_012898335.1 uncharacterized protein [Blastocystis hominis]